MVHSQTWKQIQINRKGVQLKGFNTKSKNLKSLIRELLDADHADFVTHTLEDLQLIIDTPHQPPPPPRQPPPPAVTAAAATTTYIHTHRHTHIHIYTHTHTYTYTYFYIYRPYMGIYLIIVCKLYSSKIIIQFKLTNSKTNDKYLFTCKPHQFCRLQQHNVTHKNQSINQLPLNINIRIFLINTPLVNVLQKDVK